MALFLSIIDIFRLWLLRYVNSFMALGDVLKLDSLATYNFRTYRELHSRNSETVKYGTEIISLLAQ